MQRDVHTAIAECWKRGSSELSAMRKTALLGIENVHEKFLAPSLLSAVAVMCFSFRDRVPVRIFFPFAATCGQKGTSKPGPESTKPSADQNVPGIMVFCFWLSSCRERCSICSTNPRTLHASCAADIKIYVVAVQHHFFQAVRVQFPKLRGTQARKHGVKMTLPTWPHSIILTLPP